MGHCIAVPSCVDRTFAGGPAGRIEFTHNRPGAGKSGTRIPKMGVEEVDSHKIPHTIPFLMAIDETFDVGMGTWTPVDDHDYQVPFRFTGKLGKLTFKLGREQLTDADRQNMNETIIRAKD